MRMLKNYCVEKDLSDIIPRELPMMITVSINSQLNGWYHPGSFEKLDIGEL